MPPVTRMWLAFAAICTGIIHAALAATAPLPLAVPLALLGLAELAWGALASAAHVTPALAATHGGH